MGVYIKDMEVPTSCAVCGWGSYVGNGRAMCLKTSMTEKTDIMSNRIPDWCPLVEVPAPHGRLIDADALMEAAKKCTAEIPNKVLGTSILRVCSKLIGEAPTILDAADDEWE